jgi:trans-aconitate methyltransferase
MNIYLEKFIKEKFVKFAKALDLGAGNFYDISYLKYLGWECEGVDRINNIDLEKPYKSINSPFDLVYSNYVLQKIKNKETFVKTAYNNLKNGGWLFIHTFDKTDRNSHSNLDRKVLKNLLKNERFTDIKTNVFSFYDNNLGHKHWHKILEVSARKIK